MSRVSACSEVKEFHKLLFLSGKSYIFGDGRRNSYTLRNQRQLGRGYPPLKPEEVVEILWRFLGF